MQAPLLFYAIASYTVAIASYTVAIASYTVAIATHMGKIWSGKNLEWEKLVNLANTKQFGNL